jgi:acyl-CoA synthetase (AMP-forming)/AMP-acid ligase II
MLTSRSMGAHTRSISKTSDMDADSVTMVAMPLFHVGGSGFALLALGHGATILVVRDIEPVSLLGWLQECTHAFLVPAVFGFLVQVPGAAERDYSRTRTLYYGASPMPIPLLRASMAMFRGVNFQQVYGMTEASGGVTVLGAQEHRDPGDEHVLTSAGKPIPGVEIAIVDPISGERLATGEVGEVCVRTEQLMAGYWHKPDADRAALTDDGWLRTGDAGYLDDNGYLYISDRIKDMIISGGENIYPAEIERVLAEHPDVAEVTVIGVPDAKWGEVGKAIVVPKPGVELDDDAVLAFCRQHLASFKCPKSLTVVAELPRNATGKVLKRQLREPFWAGHEARI